MVIPHGGEKHINKIPRKLPGTTPRKSCFCVFSLFVFFASHSLSMLAVPAAVCRGAQGLGQKSAPKSAFRVLGGAWLGVPTLWSTLWGTPSQAPKKHSLGHFLPPQPSGHS